MAFNKEMNIILDLDETLITNFIPRPYVKQFLSFCFTEFKSVSVWTAAVKSYADNNLKILTEFIPPNKKFDVIFTRKNCTPKFSSWGSCYFTICYTKPLRKLWKRNDGVFKKTNTIIIDDTYQKQNYGNAIQISEFNQPTICEEMDTVLLQLINFLQNELIPHFRMHGDVRTLDKRVNFY